MVMAYTKKAQEKLSSLAQRIEKRSPKIQVMEITFPVFTLLDLSLQTISGGSNKNDS